MHVHCGSQEMVSAAFHWAWLRPTRMGIYWRNETKASREPPLALRGMTWILYAAKFRSSRIAAAS